MFIGLVVVLIVSGCAVVRGEDVRKVALLAPFEGRYRQVGYEALYAARLALADAGARTFDLLAVDDGGDIHSAVDRARALRRDPAVVAALLSGPRATVDEVQAALGDLPAVIVGHWDAQPTGADVVMLASAQLDAIINAPEGIGVLEAARLAAPVVGGDVFALAQYPRLRGDVAGIRIASSGRLPDEAFRGRYLANDDFAPEPGLWATLTYDAMRVVMQGVGGGVALGAVIYEGVNGRIAFDDAGYWRDAPVHAYHYAAAGSGSSSPPRISGSSPFSQATSRGTAVNSDE